MDKRKMNLTNTKEMSQCETCLCMTYILIDENGNRFCGKCKSPKKKERGLKWGER